MSLSAEDSTRLSELTIDLRLEKENIFLIICLLPYSGSIMKKMWKIV
jgi:hypothetical protein